MLGGLIMCHGDDFGLVLPPAVAPTQAVVVAIKDTDGSVTRTAAALVDELKRRGVRSRLDDDVESGFGRRATEWDLQGVPIRVEVGPKEVADDAAVLFRRDTREKNTVSLRTVADDVHLLTERIQADMLDAATARRDATITDCSTLDEVRDAAGTGVARVPWDVVGPSGEATLAADGLTVRCLQAPDGSLPDADAGAIAYVARAY